MATLLLSAAGAAIGGSVGGSVLGISAAMAGRFAGAVLGNAIDQRILGKGGAAVETDRIERFRLTNSGEGAAIARVFGAMRVSGQIIWSSGFVETVTTTGGGKGSASAPTVSDHSYSVNIALALCEGEISGIGRIWADGAEVSAEDLNLRVYKGTYDQQPDPKMEAIEGAGQVPAYRGTAYVVLEDLVLEPFGNRVPQLSFEVIRTVPAAIPGAEAEPSQAIRGVALMPGCGEYALATSPVAFDFGAGKVQSINVNSHSGKSDLLTSLDQLDVSLPKCEAVSLIVSWFGSDLRCGECQISPKVEQTIYDGNSVAWSVSGVSRSGASTVPMDGEDRPIYGGTPCDASVIEAIQALQAHGKAVMFYPFLMMDQMVGNALADPYGVSAEQPALPWRGRITGSIAPGVAGSPDETSVMESEVALFFGTVNASHFSVAAGSVAYSGPAEWSYRRFILHCAALCAAAGGVDSFCIGSELVGLTTLRGTENSFPAVDQLCDLAGEVRQILGSQTKLGYAADWTEYSGYQPQTAQGDRFFHLDSLWADNEIDFIGIDNYMPVSDWRDGFDHSDASLARSIYDEAYLGENIAGGELYDWYYASDEDRSDQIRTPISDGAYGEPWVWRIKDLVSWWTQPHHERISGIRQTQPTDWIPQSKPIWFTELGCAAVDKGTNQPNKFLDPKSSESALPYFSHGGQDVLIQHQYLKVMHRFWNDPGNNPSSTLYSGRMVDMSRAFVWAWDARPFPVFPNNLDLWGDGENYGCGHWVNGRASSRSLASVVAEICEAAGLKYYDVSGLYGVVHGYAVDEVTAPRNMLQPLMLRFGFDAVEREGMIVFAMRGNGLAQEIATERLAVSRELEDGIEISRSGEAEIAGRVRVHFVENGADYDLVSEEALLPFDASEGVAGSELPLVMSRGEGRQIAERWLAEARLGRDAIRLSLPPSKRDIGPGDILAIGDGDGVTEYRVDRAEYASSTTVEAVRTDLEIYVGSPIEVSLPSHSAASVPLPVLPLYMDLPLMRGDEDPYAPHVAVTGDPWPGNVALFSSSADAGYALDMTISGRSTIGVTMGPLTAGPVGRPDLGNALEIALTSGILSSTDDAGLLNGQNLIAIGDGSVDGWELVQFRDVEISGSGKFKISHRLRGQLGTDGAMRDVWPAGSYVVLLDGKARQLSLAPSLIGLERHYRLGPAMRSPDDASFRHDVMAFMAAGLRPYSPCHLVSEIDPEGNLDVSWVRRTRVNGDSWTLPDVPLGEESLQFRVRVLLDDIQIRESFVSQERWTYTAAEQSSDGAAGEISVLISQVSAICGAGTEKALSVLL